jgi:hypothetical protein
MKAGNSLSVFMPGDSHLTSLQEEAYGVMFSAQPFFPAQSGS